MERGFNCCFNSLTVFCFLLHCWVQIDQCVGYSLGNCTIRGSLKEYDRPKVLCYNLQYQTVPKTIPHNAEVLDICCNRISEIKVGELQQLVHLKFLNLTKNRVYHVEAGAFKDLIMLQELNLAKNRLRTISKNYFQGLDQLRTLRLDYNFITTLEASAFSTLVNLKVINITHNNLQNIKEITPIFQLPSIGELYSGSNCFSHFHSRDLLRSALNCNKSEVFFGVKILDLSWNPLKNFSITENILPHLEVLDLAYSGPNGNMTWDVRNHTFLSSIKKLNLSGIHMSVDGIEAAIESVSMSVENLKLYDMRQVNVSVFLKDICQLPTLRVLRLRKNNFTSLSDHTFPPCLQVNKLDFVENRLTSLSQNVFKPIWNLSDLLLGHNRLSKVPSAIRVLNVLNFLDLTYNSIDMLTCSDFTNLTQLTRLHLYRNHISKLTACIFNDLSKLEVLLLGSNKLLTIADTFMSGLLNLQRLELGSNKLSSIKMRAFRSLQSLQFLDLIDNQINKVEEMAFVKLTNLTRLQLSSNKINRHSLTSRVFFGMPNLKILEISSNYISYEDDSQIKDPPFMLLKSLIYLKIDSQAHKGLQNIPSNFLKGLAALQAVHAGNLNMISLNTHVFQHTPHLSFLDISKNLFTSLNPEMFQAIPELNKLLLSKGRLHSLDFLIQANLTNLRYLQARRNQLAVVNKSMVLAVPSLTLLNLQENSFTCDCSNAWFINWTVSDNHTQVVGASKFDCSYPPHLRGNKLLGLDTEYCTVNVSFVLYVATTIVVLLTLSGSFFCHFLYWQVVYAYYLLLAFVYDNKQRKNRKRHNFQYDAFVSYNVEDELWVMRELLPQLEGKQGWKLCLHHRDFQPGRFIMDNIVDGIYNSRKTICLISRHYLESEWCSREIQLASFRLFDEKKDVLVLVFLEDIPAHQLSPYHRLRQIVKKRTYLTWPKPGNDTRVFWCKLKEALETTNEPEEGHSALAVM